MQHAYWHSLVDETRLTRNWRQCSRTLSAPLEKRKTHLLWLARTTCSVGLLLCPLSLLIDRLRTGPHSSPHARVAGIAEGTLRRAHRDGGTLLVQSLL
eukprot:5090634-Amphidinium_carterae.1